MTAGVAGLNVGQGAVTSPEPVLASSQPALELAVLGVGLWAEGLGTWAQARATWRGESALDAPATTPTKPQAAMLPPAERRRAPATVSLALAVAEQACQASGLAPQRLRSVFCSAYGDLEITDYLCATLAESPAHLSPTKFHHSVHNAASGYWTIGVGNMQASTALSAGENSFALALLEAATQAVCEQAPVLLVAYDMPATGPLVSINQSTALLGMALVLAPLGVPPFGETGVKSAPTLSVRLQAAMAPSVLPTDGVPDRSPAHPCAWPRHPATAALMGRNPMAAALPLFEAMALADEPGQGASNPFRFPLSPTLTLTVAFNSPR